MGRDLPTLNPPASRGRDLATADKIVRRYLKRQGGEGSGFSFDEVEERLAEDIVIALQKARKEG